MAGETQPEPLVARAMPSNDINSAVSSRHRFFFAPNSAEIWTNL
jgi:hypothetical protein